jgi:CRISPR-associated protein Cas5t
LQLQIRGPFAAFRTFTAGAYRPTAPFMTPSAAYGLLLNLAGVETRWDDGKAPMTLMCADLPSIELALGSLNMPEVHSVYQQLHNYPVGSLGKDRAADCKGSKYNIQPVRREFLAGLDAYVCCRGNPDIEQRIRGTLSGLTPPDAPRRYGIPFLGDNNFMIDIIREVEGPQVPARWLHILSSAETQEGSGRMRLSVSIDRAEMTQTRNALFVWSGGSSPIPPDDCWTMIARS